MGWKITDLPEKYQQQAHEQAASRSRDTSKVPDVEQGPELQEKGPVENQSRLQVSISGRIVIRVISYRKQLADPDGLCAKWYIDQLIEAMGLDDDSLKNVARVEFEQVKAKEEKTVLQVYEASE